MSHSRKGAHERTFMEWHLAAPFFIFGGKSIKGTVRINRKIRVPQVRLVDESGALVGVIDTSAAVQMAEERGYDQWLRRGESAGADLWILVNTNMN